MEKVRFTIHVTPKSAKDEIVGWKENVLYIRVTAPPVGGTANKACIELIAKHLGVRKGQVTLVSGATGRRKVIEIEGVTENTVRSNLS